jgi:hypothetical protein
MAYKCLVCKTIHTGACQASRDQGWTGRDAPRGGGQKGMSRRVNKKTGAQRRGFWRWLGG